MERELIVGPQARPATWPNYLFIALNFSPQLSYVRTTGHGKATSEGLYPISQI